MLPWYRLWPWYAYGDHDHINMTGQNPLIGENLDEFGPRFPDMSKSYTPEYRAVAHKVADKLGIKLDEGVYRCNWTNL